MVFGSGLFFGTALSIVFRKRWISSMGFASGVWLGISYYYTNHRLQLMGALVEDPVYKHPEKKGKYLTDE